MRILSAESMREVDRRAVEEVGVPSLVLMENAALGLVEAVASMGEAVSQVAIFCGPGNNGGDGLALARHLDARGWAVQVFLATAGKEIDPDSDAGVQLGIVREQGIPLWRLGEGEDLGPVFAAAREADLVVDALFGTGLGRPLEGQPADLVERINELPLPVLAVDLPSGLGGSRCDVFGPAVRAERTVTFAAPKVACVFPPAAELCGEVGVSDLGIPPRLVAEAPAEPEELGELHLLDAAELAGELPRREAGAHKGSVGHVLVVAGAPGKSGAAILTARGAVRGGAGLVTAAVPEPILPTVDGASLESMTLALPAGEGGGIDGASVEAVLGAAEGKTVLALGPGLGQDEATFGAIRRIVLECELPAVLDADGINAFAGRAGELAGRGAPTILTPHPGELGRLLGVGTEEIAAGHPARIEHARRAARETGSIVVLKGHLTLVAAPDGSVRVCPTGNPGMATGGSGDVLTGLLAGLLAQRPGVPEVAARLAVYLHGAAGDLAAARRGEIPLAAADLLDAFPEALAALQGRGLPAGGR